MKVAVVLLALVAIGYSAPQPRKVFHEHFEDFINIIAEEAGDELGNIMGQYIEFEEFIASLEYLRTANFRDLIYEMESLPEFKAVIEFLENDNIDILYFLDVLNDMLEYTVLEARKARAEVSGKDFSSFINDSIDVFPKDKLAALFEQKKAEDEAFRVAIENLESEEWSQVFDALWQNEVFQKEVQTLDANGINVNVVLAEIQAIFGQR